MLRKHFANVLDLRTIVKWILFCILRLGYIDSIDSAGCNSCNGIQSLPCPTVGGLRRPKVNVISFFASVMYCVNDLKLFCIFVHCSHEV